MVPVLDMTGKYLGAVNEHEALRRLSEVANVREPGSVLVLEMNQVDYSLQEIARIVEGNDAKVLSVYCHPAHGQHAAEVTLKINREDISDILQTFERYEYYVKTTFQGSRFHEDLRGRYDELMRMIESVIAGRCPRPEPSALSWPVRPHHAPVHAAGGAGAHGHPRTPGRS